LRDWGNAHRFAGAGDRAAIGNLVYDALRRRASTAWLAGGDTPWHLAIGTVVRAGGIDPDDLNGAFADDARAPRAIPDDVAVRLRTADLSDADDAVRADLPDWAVPHFQAAFGDDWVRVGAALAERPPLDLRVNALKADRAKVARQLVHLGAEAAPLSPVGLRIAPMEGARRHPNVQAEEAYLRGRVEIQDAGSQLCALLLGARPGEQVIDLCAGAGGKTLAIAAAMENRGQIYATDRDKTRLAPIFDRLRRAGVRNVQVRSPTSAALDDLAGRMDRVIVDAPCSGSGAWRRRPDAKWRMGQGALAQRLAEQRDVLAQAATLVRPGGLVEYVTCSVLPPENEQQVSAFLKDHGDFELLSARDAWARALPEVPSPAVACSESSLQLTPARTQTDGFFVAWLMRRA